MSPEEAVRRVAQAREMLVNEVHKVIIGQDEMIEQMLICIFARGHCLTIGVPGLAKTLTVSTLAQALHMKFTRIQFTPDLMPSDITGTEIIDQDQSTGQRNFRFVRGPIFSNIVLADEINRTPPKTQAALLQAMQEYEVSSAGKTYQLEPPFFVMATQNPIEQEGTYPLPEAQLDRFMLSISIGYPTRSEEREIVNATTQSMKKEIHPVLQGRDILWIQQLVRQVPASQHMVEYAVDLVRATRPREPPSPDFVKNWLAWGAGPRAAQNIILTAKARAILHGRYAVTTEDLRAMAFPVLRHRIFTNFNADAEGVDVEQVIEKIVATIPEPTYGEGVAAHARGAAVPKRAAAGRSEEQRATTPAAAPMPQPAATSPQPVAQPQPQTPPAMPQPVAQPHTPPAMPQPVPQPVPQPQPQFPAAVPQGQPQYPYPPSRGPQPVPVRPVAAPPPGYAAPPPGYAAPPPGTYAAPPPGSYAAPPPGSYGPPRANPPSGPTPPQR
jgi:MoxR-like ATPase